MFRSFFCDHGGRSWYMWSWSQEKIINDSKTFALLCVIVHQTKLPVILQVTADKSMIEEVLGQLPTRKIAPGWWLLVNCPPPDNCPLDDCPPENCPLAIKFPPKIILPTQAIPLKEYYKWTENYALSTSTIIKESIY